MDRAGCSRVCRLPLNVEVVRLLPLVCMTTSEHLIGLLGVVLRRIGDWAARGQFETVALTSPFAGKQPLTRRPKRANLADSPRASAASPRARACRCRK